MGNLNPWYCIIFLWYFIMKTNMYDYICETPDVLTYIINNRKEIVQEFVNEYKDKKIDQIYVIGSGTSYHAGLSAKNYLEEILNIKVFVCILHNFLEVKSI